MSKYDKYFKDFEPPEDTGGTPPAGLTANDLQAVESRINHYIDESIKRLDAKLDTITNKQTITTAPDDGASNNESEVKDNV